MMVQRLGLTKLFGPGMLWPVIPPLLREGGVRCSVKPASRSVLQSKCQETSAFAQVP
ncbi:hypothetical protein L195_g034431 [Trifolium pratense]|uniref:Uncharacterized protein n=1 Tax=Trifolium pratense TaxID=57577 RepID=A0A2K3LIV4_TRIPR|nr:hypothetical protein L195_g034431 [Trifolium pratense]